MMRGCSFKRKIASFGNIEESTLEDFSRENQVLFFNKTVSLAVMY